MKAAIYCRISRDRKIDGTHTMLGVERQEQDCRELCRTLGWEVADVFVDNDISATSGKVRPAYKAMLALVAAGDVDAIVCWHPDRLYRRTVDLEELVKVCDTHRVPIATVNAGAVDLTTPTGRLVAGLLAQVARYEGEHKAERWKRSYKQRRDAGRPQRSGSRLFGYTRDGEVVAVEAAAINAVVDHLLVGGTLMQACRDLNERGLRTTRGNEWKHQPLRGLLLNPRLTGWVTYKGERLIRSEWPPILTEERHEAVKALLLARHPKRPPAPRKATLLGIAVCGTCGGRLVTGHQSSARASRTYRCSGAGVPGQTCVSILAVEVERIVEAYAQARLEDPRVRAELARARQTGHGSRIAEEIATLEARLVALNAALADTDRPVPEVMRAITEVKARIEEASERLAGVVPVVMPSDLVWPEDTTRRRALIGLVVARVTIAPVPPERRGFAANGYLAERVTITPRV